MKKNTQQINKTKWHALETERIFGKLYSPGKVCLPLKCRADGMSATPIRCRLPSRQVFSRFLHQLKNLLIVILMTVALFALFVRKIFDVIFIVTVILLTSVLGTNQKYSAEESAASLQKMMKIIARVRRSGRDREVYSQELVPGDIVLMESGMNFSLRV